jgi:hypothetical protein
MNPRARENVGKKEKEKPDMKEIKEKNQQLE